MSFRTIKGKVRGTITGAAKAVRHATDPTSIITEKIVDAVIPGASDVQYKMLDPTYVAETVSPLQTPAQHLENLQRELFPSEKREPKVIPHRDAYSASASSAAAKQAAAKAKAEREKNTSESIANAQKAAALAYQAEQAAKKAEQTTAAKEAEKPSTEATAAEQAATIQTTAPGEVRVIIDAANIAREAALNEQQLPEVYVKSDFKKYLIFGGVAVAAIWFFTRKKKG